MATSPVFTSAGTTIQVSASLPGTYNLSSFAGLSYTAIGEVTDLGEFGREYNLVTHNPLGDRRTVKRKGSYNDGAVSMTLARVPSDAGQALLIAGLDSDNSYSFKVTLQDGTIQYFTAQIMSYTTNIGGVDQITSASVTLEIDDDIIEDIPTP